MKCIGSVILIFFLALYANLIDTDHPTAPTLEAEAEAEVLDSIDEFGALSTELFYINMSGLE